jgi:DNA-binding response OmpR family regulator
MCKCPRCGLDLETQKDDTHPKVFLETNLMFANGIGLQLTGKEAEVAYALAESMPMGIGRERLATKVWGATQDIEAAEWSLRVYVQKLRKKIAPIGLRINCIWGTGYRMENTR